MGKLLVGLLMVFSAGSAWAQREISEDGSKTPFGDRLYFGGGLGFSSGSTGVGRYTYVGLYPIVGYQVTNNFSTGATITYQYYDYPDQNYSLTQYGISPFLRYNFGQMFAYTEYMILNSPSYDPGSQRRTYNRWLVGLGFRQPVGKRGSINVMGLYDVIYNPADRVFTSPWVFRVFFAF
ncbi:MAG TPA: hypothetical protein VG737_15710 [Cyclobacteriaceae bacterium]|nr:hypothetical protein [Cyclobacteriaceae bacterium]